MSSVPPPIVSTPAPPRRRRWLRRGLLTAAAVLLLVLAAPLYAGKLLAPLLVSELEQRLDARVTLAGASFAWPAEVSLRGLALADQAGAPLASLDLLEGSLELLPLLSGELRARLALDYPELHLARSADGRWNWEAALAKALEKSGAEDAPASDEEEPLPRVKLDLALRDGHLIVHGVEGDTTLADLALELALDGLERPAPYHLAFGLRGPSGPAGRVTLEGEFTAALHGKLEPSGLAARARLALEELDLAAFEPAAALLAPVDGLRGQASGALVLELGEGLTLKGTSDLVVRGLELAGPLAPREPTRIEEIKLVGTASQQGEGAGTQRFELSADEFLSLVYEGSSNVPAAGAGELLGTLVLKGDLARLSTLARGWVPFEPGVALAGKLEQRLTLGASFVDRAPSAATLTLGGGLVGLAARDARGRALDLDGLAEVTLALEASADLDKGTLRVPKLALAAGPVTFRAGLAASGLALDGAPGALVLEDGAFDLAADLEALRGTLAQLVTLEEGAFGGHLSAQGSLKGSAAAGLTLLLVLEARGLALGGSRLASCAGELRAQRGGDGALSGAGELRLGPSELALSDGRLPLPGAKLQLDLAEDAHGVGRHALALTSDDGALELALKIDSERKPDELALTTALELRGDVAGLAALAAPLVTTQPGLAGKLTGKGTLALTLAGATPTRAAAELEFGLAELQARDAEGKPLPLEALAETRLTLAASYDAAAQRAELTRLALAAGGLALEGRATLGGLDLAAPFRPEALEVSDGHVELTLELERLGAEVARAVDLGGASFGGSALTLALDLTARAGRADAQGKLAAERLRYTRAEGAPLELAPLAANFDLGLELEKTSLHVRTAKLTAGAAEIELAGTLNELADPARARGTMTLALSAELERLLAELGLETPDSGRQTRGRLTGKFQLDGDQGAFRLGGSSEVADFRLELAPTTSTAAPFVLTEPRIMLGLDAAVTLATREVALEKLTLDSGLLRGSARGTLRSLPASAGGELVFEGLKGEFAYVPDRLGALLAPFLPGQLAGAEEQRASFDFSGKARDFTLEYVLANTSGRIELGLGQFLRPEVTLGGKLALETRAEKALLRGDLSANGGTLTVDGTLDLGREKPRSRLALTAKDVKANAGLAPLLGLVHPAFAASSLTGGELGGLIGLTLDVTYDGPLALDQLAQGWQGLAKEPINGTGSLSLSGANLKGSPLLAALKEFGIDAEKELDLRPIDFTIKKGRLSYARPWSWTIAGTETSFSGSLGLDQTLALDWSLPITPELVRKYDFLSVLVGEKISVPVRGTALAPRLDTGGLLKDLAAKAARKTLEGKLGLGGGNGAEGDDPDSLLKKADQLWSQDKKAEAARIYVRLKDDFKLSLTYALNKDRIKDRAKYKP